MPNQNRNGRKPPDRLFVRVFEDGCIGGGYAYCLTPPEGFDSVEYAQVTTNQNECDHVVVHSNNVIVSASELSDHIQRRIRTRYNARERVKQYSLMQFLDGRTGLMNKFDYCPNCGVKIDWDKIKEELDGK